MTGMQRTVSSRLEAWAADQTTIVLAVAVSARHHDLTEHLFVTVNGEPAPIREIVDALGGRQHVLDVPASSFISIDYEATVFNGAPGPSSDEAERIRFLRPSRYCDSDALEPFARATFGSLGRLDLIDEIRQWVGSNIEYVPGVSRPTDGASSTLLTRQGVCRDFAHLTTALLRARDVPARVVSVYAPGLSPMDFHAVTEVEVNGDWFVVDSTGLAPRGAMVRIATGADASDIAFLTNIGGRVDLGLISVMAVADDGLPNDDPQALIELA